MQAEGVAGSKELPGAPRCPVAAERMFTCSEVMLCVPDTQAGARQKSLSGAHAHGKGVPDSANSTLICLLVLNLCEFVVV